MEPGFLWKENGDRTGAARMSGGLNNKSLEWDLNDWRWDANLFLATPASAAPSECSSRELSGPQGEIDFGVVVDKRRRVSPEDGSAGCSNSAVANGENHGVVVQRGWSSEEERPRKGASSSSPPSCQVDGCQVDLSGARDYHKRHKVCEAHTRSTVVRIKSVEHRFCQQCSRFHLLQEFDEGKKSCRSRLAKHNVRRRKVQPQAGVDDNSMNENQSLSSTLFLLLKQLSGLESGSSSKQINHPNYLVNLLKNLTAIAGTQEYQDMLKNTNRTSILSNAVNNVTNGFTVCEQIKRPIPVGTESSAEVPPVKRRVQDFDLNDAYIEEVESRTDKIVFKLFGKEPKDFPVDLRAQILNWLSQYPSDMESYIRPGCVILTVYLRLPNWMWDELDDDPTPWIEKLISMSNDGFWRTGWVYARVQDCLTLSCNGSLMLASPWQLAIGDKHQRIFVTPIAVACSSTVNFSVKGFNIVQPTTKLLCIFGEKYLIQEETQMLLEDTTMQQGPQCLKFSCSFPSTSGRGFIEVEDYDQSSLSVPFVVTEEDACSEIRMLEHELNLSSVDETLEGIDNLMVSHNRALHFLQEFGWLLQRIHIRAMSEQGQYCTEGFPVARFRWLLSFAIDQEWCAVLKKLLNTMFQGNIDIDAPSPVEFAIGEDLLFTAVNKRSKPLIEFLLRYTITNPATMDSGAMAPVQFLFTPEMTGLSNITPLHIAATISDAADVLDALTDDPQQLGIKAWKNARDDTGFTPEDYARKRGHISYIQMVQDKIDSRIPKANVSVAIPSGPSTTDTIGKHASRLKSPDQTTFDVEKSQRSIKQPLSCRECVQQLVYRPRTNRFLSNRPAMLSLVAIAAVCVCVGLIMKSPPQVGFMRPFIWEHINWGPK
ncbi:squamosa promoter-binding-like protein 1 [Phragmites australis]|uniref:squamosa promoter-binding-like protein 1 n=1 Tax=Phragmites australis TaxID=29695 RepID=UPI002D790CB6|nr:squamosa promoter-binding-like protein 1 [Phragmites australis]XP_062197119.1 squamosa promoter-binding-like protein 1 [Phragmites australis]XP_062197126.1 squamosa promoter-binding-like protein 1 [Phragmites australis]